MPATCDVPVTKARARCLGCIVSCVKVTSKLSHSVFLGSNAKISSRRHPHDRGRIVGRRPDAGLLFRPAPCVCVERAGNVFVPRRDSFVYRVVVIRLALILKPVDKSGPGGTDRGGNDFDILVANRKIGLVFICCTPRAMSAKDPKRTLDPLRLLVG